MYIINPTVGHDCSLKELQEKIVEVDVLERGTKEYTNFRGQQYVWCTVEMYGYKRFYPSCRLTSNKSIAEYNRREILKKFESHS